MFNKNRRSIQMNIAETVSELFPRDKVVKRFRAPKAKPGELKAQWGKLAHDTADICYAWGECVSKADAHLLHNALSSEHLRHLDNKWTPSLLKELESRGYDLTTLKFSIQKKSD